MVEGEEKEADGEKLRKVKAFNSDIYCEDQISELKANDPF